MGIKSEHLNRSWDNAEAGDTEMMNTVLEEIDILTSVTLFSDKCGPKEVEKM